MATVPQYEIGQVKDSPVQGGQQQIQTIDEAFGSSIAQANIARGQALSQLGDQAWQVAFKQRDKFDQAVLKDQDNQLQTFIREQMDDPGGYLSLTGKDALDQKAIIEKAIQERMKLLGKAVDSRILDQWKVVANQRINTAFGRISSHSARETTTYYNTVSDSRIAGALHDSITNWESRDEREKYIKFGINEVNQKIERVLGISPDTQDEDEKAIFAKYQLEFTSPAHTGIIEKLLEADQYDRANDYYTIHKDEIKADSQLALKKAIEANTRDGQVAENVQRIWTTPGLSDTEQTDMADAIDDKALAALVRAKLEHMQTYRDKEELDDYQDADNAAQTLVTNGNLTSTDQIPKDVWNKMSPGKQEYLKKHFQDEEVRIRNINQLKAKEDVYAQYAIYRFDNTQPMPSVDDILKMSGPEAVAFFDKREADALKDQSDDANEAFLAVKLLQARGVPKSEIDKELLDRLTGEQLELIDDRYKINIERLETQAYNQGLAIIAAGGTVGDDLLNQMDGVQQLSIKKEAAADDRSEEGIAYDKLLGHLLVPGNTLENAPQDLLDAVSREHMYNLTNAINTTKAAQAKINQEISEFKNFTLLLDLAQKNPEAFAQQWDRDKLVLATSLSETNWKLLDQMRREPNYTKSVITRQNTVYSTLAGLKRKGESFIFSKKDKMSTLITEASDDGDNVRGFVREVNERVQAWSDQHEGRTPNDDEFNQILLNVASDVVFYDVGPNGLYPASFIEGEEREDAYVRIEGEEYTLDIVPAGIRDQIIADMRENKETVSEKEIIIRYLDWKSKRLDLKLNVEL